MKELGRIQKTFFGAILLLLLGAGCRLASVPTTLFQAARLDDVGAVRRLLKSGVDVDHRDFVGWTALNIASLHGSTRCIEFLLDSGARIESRTPSGHTPLMQAAMFGHEDAVRLLLDRGADPNVAFNDGISIRAGLENM